MAMALAAPAQALDEIDASRSDARFVLDLPFGRTLEGRFNRIEGELLQEADGRMRVRLVLPSGSAEIPGHPRYTRILRGPGFFDSENHPQVQFASDPFDPGLIRDGHLLEGTLTLRGATGRTRMLTRAQPDCRLPAHTQCTVEVQGRVRRSDYGMRDLRGFVGDHVGIRLRIVTGKAR